MKMINAVLGLAVLAVVPKAFSDISQLSISEGQTLALTGGACQGSVSLSRDLYGQLELTISNEECKHISQNGQMLPVSGSKDFFSTRTSVQPNDTIMVTGKSGYNGFSITVLSSSPAQIKTTKLSIDKNEKSLADSCGGTVKLIDNGDDAGTYSVFFSGDSQCSTITAVDANGSTVHSASAPTSPSLDIDYSGSADFQIFKNIFNSGKVTLSVASRSSGMPLAKITVSIAPENTGPVTPELVIKSTVGESFPTQLGGVCGGTVSPSADYTGVTLRFAGVTGCSASVTRSGGYAQNFTLDSNGVRIANEEVNSTVVTLRDYSGNVVMTLRAAKPKL